MAARRVLTPAEAQPTLFRPAAVASEKLQFGWQRARRPIGGNAVRCILVGIGVALSLLLHGCVFAPLAAGPELPPENLAELDKLTQWDRVRKAFSEAGGDETKLIQARNDYISYRTAAIDARFLAYLRSLSVSRTTLDAATQEAVLGLGVAGTLVSSVTAKTNLAAAIALVTGSKATVDSTYFANQTVDAMAAAMIAARKEAYIYVLLEMRSPPSPSSLETARQVVNDYYDAGTFKRAIAFVHQEAAVREKKADVRINNLRVVRNTPENLSKPNEDLKRELTRRMASAATFTPEQLRGALIDLGRKPASLPPGFEELADELAGEIRSADTDDKLAHIKKVLAAHHMLN
jgi:hypothetical protein